ncbi:MAG: hypothetical protein WCV81_04045 [Microgenomates group bacterium]
MAKEKEKYAGDEPNNLNGQDGILEKLSKLPSILNDGITKRHLTTSSTLKIEAFGTSFAGCAFYYLMSENDTLGMIVSGTIFLFFAGLLARDYFYLTGKRRY